MNQVDDLLYKEECFIIIGICMKVHNILGNGFKEIIYHDALELEFRRNAIPYEREKKFSVLYEGVELKRKFFADFFVYNSIVLELKALYMMPTNGFRQTLNYLKAAEVKLGILINFGEDKLSYKRIICTR